ncbi:MAG: hypothetical protein SWO11_23375, partial [Thermodesulfobacteriota bacterium]|nr:hypothetical protein [Thermodesulfobacteriota bacterium]
KRRRWDHMKAIYQPTGKAREYGDLACNLYRGCAHGCDYCYAPGVFRPRMTKEEFANSIPRPGILKALEKDAKKYSGSRVPIFLSFTSDPYQPIENNSITRKAMQILHENRCGINILTKGGMRAAADFDILAANSDSWFGTTLTYSDELKSKEHEPGAAIPKDRITAIKEAKKMGINTWVSMEPIVGYKPAISLIYNTIDFVDLYKIGKMNHRKGISSQELKDFLTDAIMLLDSNGKDYYIKMDTRPFVDKVAS